MEAFIDFIQSYWQYISAGILILIEVLILFLKKRPKTIDDFSKCLADSLNLLPSLIVSVEVPGNGVQKKDQVVKACLRLFQKLIGRDLSDGEYDSAKKIISEQVEKILLTPQKKGN